MSLNIFRNLNARQRLFVTEYARTSNAAQSVLKAGYSPFKAPQWGYQLLQNPKVKEAISALREEQERQTLAQMRLGAIQAHEYLMEIINDPNTDTAARVEAAKGVLDSFSP